MKWPKTFPELTLEQKRRSDLFMELWHQELSKKKKYSFIESFNHLFPVLNSLKGFAKSIEVGAGLGEHLKFEILTPDQRKHYWCNEYRPNMADVIKERFPDVNVIVGDCQKRMPFEESYFDRYIAVHVFEHLPDLPGAIREAHRILKKNDSSRLLLVLPTEGSVAYTMARKVSAERVWKKNFSVPYSEFYEREHINLIPEILHELAPYFKVVNSSYFPLRIPLLSCNLCVGFALRPIG
jgi:SAM-dependent methyltransferase